MNTKTSIASIIYSLKKLDQQRHFKIADKIFNNLKIAQEVEEKVKAKTYDQLLNEMRQFGLLWRLYERELGADFCGHRPDCAAGLPASGQQL